MKAAIVILVIVCVGLGIGLAVRHNKAVDVQREAEKEIQQLSNQVKETGTDLEKQKQQTIALTSDLARRGTEVTNLENNVSQLSAQLAKAQAEAKAAAEAAQAEVVKRDSKIAELETQRDDLTKKMADLSLSITNLNAQIAATEKKLATSEGDRAFLFKELKRLQSEKAELERQFNDLVALREQVHKLKEQLSIARRLEFIRLGLYGGEKGAERLINFPKPTPRTNYDLNVEIKQGGAGKVVPPTNPPPAPRPVPK